MGAHTPSIQHRPITEAEASLSISYQLLALVPGAGYSLRD